MRRAKTLLLTTGIGLFAVSLWATWRFSEPSYQGHRLSEWLEAYGEYRYTTIHWATQAEIENALGHIGRRAIPFMLRWIQYDSVSIHSILETNDDKPRAIVREMVRAEYPNEYRADGASAAFGILKSNAISALPELARMAGVSHNHDWENPDPEWGLQYSSLSRRAIFALGSIGPAAMPYLLNLATNQSANIQCDAVYSLSQMGTNGLPAIPLLLKDILNSTNRVAYMAVRALGDLKWSPETVIPALTNVLQTDAILDPDSWASGIAPQSFFFCYGFSTIAAYGPAARPALPALLNWVNKEDDNLPDVLLPPRAADTLGKLALEPEIVVPALTKALGSHNPYLVESAAKSLAAFGPAAISAVPLLTKVRDSSTLFPARHEAARALERITNSVQKLNSE